ncbi:iron-siderophore ABC transporter substrate-binding protein [Myxacorys almedinensis]|uniref:ABC transporter substrate-binding protein n=1 Tax=Myxacorys almedinensis A TaxID=2690445 RepID=A0A8J8CN09_9CYAN|nr:iron-siderophore ABC transporter substrate-binding protein [Myxacorys almedinensis]NDJ17927.1 ABC transporter substrate-binding protein [Myxacorys almedinensis A]
MRKKSTYKIIVLLFLSAIFAFAITACNSKMQWFKQGEINSTVVRTTPLSLVQKPTATKIVNHALGQAEIPLHPQRIVVLDDSFILDPLLALSIKPVGFAAGANFINSDNLSEFVSGIPKVGDWERPSLEKILSLKPDLILGHIWQKRFYSLLSAIAPTVLIDTDSEVDFKKNLKYLADILDKSDRVDRILAEYNQRIQTFRQQLGTTLNTKTVSIVHLYGSTVHVYGSDLTVYGQIMKDAGIRLIPAYRDLKGYSGLSIEALSDWDADILFVVVLLKTDSEHLRSLSFLKQPLWSALKAVQNKQVYAVTWANTVAGPITANQFIDDLYKYFVEPS